MDKESKKTVRTFAWASFLNDLGSDMVYSLWPLFIVSLTGANMAVLGLLDGLGDALVSVSQAASGWLSDRYRTRKPFIWLGYLCGSASRAGYALAASWQWLIPFKLLDRAGKMRDAPRDAIAADVSTMRDRGANFGYLRAMDKGGAVAGVLLALLLFGVLQLGFREIFLLAAIPSVISAALVITQIREKRGRGVFKGLRLKQLNRDFRVFLMLSTVLALATFSYSFLIVYASQLGIAAAFAPLLYLLFTVTASISAVPFGQLSDQVGRKPLMALSFIMFAAACFCGLLGSVWLLPSLFIFYGLFLGSSLTVQRTFVAELSPKRYRASGIGTFQLLTGLAALPASLIAGLLWGAYGPAAMFALSAALALAATAMLALVGRR